MLLPPSALPAAGRKSLPHTTVICSFRGPRLGRTGGDAARARLAFNSRRVPGCSDLGPPRHAPISVPRCCRDPVPVPPRGGSRLAAGWLRTGLSAANAYCRLPHSAPSGPYSTHCWYSQRTLPAGNPRCTAGSNGDNDMRHWPGHTSHCTPCMGSWAARGAAAEMGPDGHSPVDLRQGGRSKG